LNKNLAHYLIKNRLIYNHLFGFDYIIKRYTNSVFKIEVKGDDVTSIGTGWLYDVNTNNLESPVLRFVITNSHVVDGFKSIIVKNKSDTIIPHLSIDSFLTTDGIDIALIQIAYDNTAPPFVLEPNVPLLEDIITIGYPSVPLSREAYQLVHRGEVNALVTDYFNQELLIVSARTAPGNSGSPVIDDTGRVVGMVTQELFEKTAFEQKGITPYSACIPSTTILKAIMKSNTLKSYHF
jgi:S1-C subfamily serine protease